MSIRDLGRMDKHAAMKAVEQTGYALKFVHTQTEAICLAAVRQNGYALQFVHNQTEDICFAAVKQDSNMIQLVRDKELFHRLAQQFKIKIESEVI